MVALVLVSHSAGLASALAAFARAAAEAPVPVAVAAGVQPAGSGPGGLGADALGTDALGTDALGTDALGTDALGTDAVAIAEAIRSVHGPDGVLVLMDLGSALLAAEAALELLPEEQRAGVRLCPAPLVEGAVAAAVQIALGADLQTVYRESSRALEPKTGQLAGADLAGAEPPRALEAVTSGGFLEAAALVPNEHGLHLRPAARLVRTAARFRAEVLVGRPAGGSVASAASLNEVATLGLGKGEEVLFRARGPEAGQALAALCRLAAERFGEPAAAPAASAPQAAGGPAAPAEKEAAAGGFLQGLPVCEGYAWGPLELLERPRLLPSARRAWEPEREWAALQQALAAERAGLESLASGAGGRGAELIEALGLILQDPALLGPLREAVSGGENAEQALVRCVQAMAARFRGLADAYAREREADVQDLGRRVLARLQRGSGEPAPSWGGQVLLAAKELSPTAAAGLEPGQVLGVLTVRGGPTAHASVLVRSLGIPCVTGLPESLLRLAPGTPVGVDGGQGRVWIRPPEDTRRLLESRRGQWQRRRAEETEASRRPAASRDGQRFIVQANIAGEADARRAVARGAEGVGVLRTEFLYLRRAAAPTEEEQLEALRGMAAALAGRPLTVRTLDIGGDKEVPYLALPAEANPYLGVRGIRLGLRRPELLRAQLRAVLRAAGEAQLRLLFPMITTLEELEGALGELERARAGLAREAVPHSWPLPVGVMVETPSAALLIEAILRRVDFVSLGTNDLTQYTLAAERGHPALAGYEDALHPAVLALVRRVAGAASARGKEAAVCGEIAADPQALPVLAGLGVRCFSLSPEGIPRVKRTLRRLDLAEAARWAEALPGLATAAEVRRQAAGFLDSLPPV